MAQESAALLGNQQPKKDNQSKSTTGLNLKIGETGNREETPMTRELIREGNRDSIAIESQIKSPTTTKDKGTTPPHRDWVESVQTGRSTRKLSWADEVEASPESSVNGSIWDNFDITRVTNAGFKLYYIAPEIHEEIPVDEIETEDITT